MRILRGAQEIKKTRLTETRIWFVLLLLAIFLSRLCFDMFNVGSDFREFDILKINLVSFSINVELLVFVLLVIYASHTDRWPKILDEEARRCVESLL